MDMDSHFLLPQDEDFSGAGKVDFRYPVSKQNKKRAVHKPPFFMDPINGYSSILTVSPTLRWR